MYSWKLLLYLHGAYILLVIVSIPCLLIFRPKAFSDAAKPPFFFFFFEWEAERKRTISQLIGQEMTLSFSPALADGWSLLKGLVLEGILQKYEHRMLSTMDDALGATACLVTAPVLNFDLQLGLNSCCNQHFTDSRWCKWSQMSY